MAGAILHRIQSERPPSTEPATLEALQVSSVGGLLAAEVTAERAG